MIFRSSHNKLVKIALQNGASHYAAYRRAEQARAYQAKGILTTRGGAEIYAATGNFRKADGYERQGGT